MSRAPSDDTIREIQEILREALALDELPDPDAHLIEDLGAESLDIVSLLFELEDRYGHQVPDDEVAKLTSVRAVAALIAAAEAEGPPGGG